MSDQIGASVPAARMKGGHVLWVVDRFKIVKTCPSNKALSIRTAGCISSVDLWTNGQHRKRGEETLGDQMLAVA